jgi:hypothetical protein
MEWFVERLGNTVHIHGPGSLQIEIRDFDQRKVLIEETPPDEEALFEDFRDRTWDYELSRGVGLRLNTTYDANRPGSGKSLLIIYHMTWRASWDVPGEFAEQLYAVTS